MRKYVIFCLFAAALTACDPCTEGPCTLKDAADAAGLRVGTVLELGAPDEEALVGFVHDPVRARLARTHDRNALVARTQLLRVEPHGYEPSE